ncbi:hypothetical protein HDU67_000760 [Dinochytrium kinnereticum]|nr:hypothetical protein HDU67_000760 [Dinochytrium kinnereticum]
MTVGTDSSRIARFNGQNYSTWSARVRDTLVINKCAKFITTEAAADKPEEVELAAIARSLINRTLDDYRIDAYSNKSTAKTLWEAIQADHRPVDSNETLSHLRSMPTILLTSADATSVDDYINNIKWHIRELTRLKYDIKSEASQCLHILGGIQCSEMADIVNHFRFKTMADLKISDIERAIRTHESTAIRPVMSATNTRNQSRPQSKNKRPISNHGNEQNASLPMLVASAKHSQATIP